MISTTRPGRILQASLVAILLSGPLSAQEPEPEGESPEPVSRPDRDRGATFSFALTGSELEAPRQTTTTDLELFTGLGLSFAGGSRFGRWRVEGELHLHTASRAFTGDTVSLRALMANGYYDLPVSRHLFFSFGAGVGSAKVDVEIDTCLDLQGCPPNAFVRADETAMAYQYMIVFGYAPNSGRQWYVGYRQFRTGSLGLSDATGRGFDDDRVDMPMALIGYTRRFGAGR